MRNARKSLVLTTIKISFGCVDWIDTLNVGPVAGSRGHGNEPSGP
jgi:hypothetical protein